MMLRHSIIVSLLFPIAAFSQATAINSLTSFWEMDVTAADAIAWDSHGNALRQACSYGPQRSWPL